MMPASENKKLIVMIGPHYLAQGGMASVIASYEDAGLFDKWPIVFLPTHVQGKKLLKVNIVISALFEFAKLALLNNVSVLHVHVGRWHSFWRKALFMSIALTLKTPVFLHLHSGGFPDFYWKDCSLIGQFFVRFFLNRAACLIVLSSQWNDLLKDITTNTKQHIIPNFVSLKETQSRPMQVRDECTLLFLGRLNHDKGLSDLIEAISSLKDIFPLLRLEVGGDGDEKPMLEMASRLGVEDRISFHGWVAGNAKDQLIGKATLYVLPSYLEGLPMGVLEAMANGLPVITTDVGGIPDIIQSGYNGIMVKAGDVEGLASAIKLLLSQPGLAKKIGVAAHNTIINQFSTEVVLPKLTGLYETFGIMPRARPSD